MTTNCGTCRFFEPNECHAHPPTTFPVRFQPMHDVRRTLAIVPGVGQVEQGPQPERIAGWASAFAPTKPTNWCGEWTPRQEPES